MSAPHRRPPSEFLRQVAVDVGPFLSCDDCFRQTDQFVDGLIAGEDEPIGPHTAAMRSPSHRLPGLLGGDGLPAPAGGLAPRHRPVGRAWATERRLRAGPDGC